ncbi:hypothetical protein [Fictibacillus macauensis]|uniref:hypothetical protein n=1 Tax=Fictibacillus macauensis TaxID=245160 RepID=UPI000302CC1F|nr:hypothetical protein [Fictibacillus macauensis]
MLRWLIKLAVIVAIIAIGYQARYRLLNEVLGVPWIRRFAVGRMMSLPGVRNAMMKQLF